MDQLSCITVDTRFGAVSVWTSDWAVVRVILPGGEVSSDCSNTYQSGMLADKAGKLITDYFHGLPVRLDLPVDISEQPPFYREVLSEVRAVPRGCTVTYGKLAVMCGKPGAAQAVGQAMAKNPVPLFIPCHRVVGARGPGGFGGGLELKRWLLTVEGVKVLW